MTISHRASRALFAGLAVSALVITGLSACSSSSDEGSTATTAAAAATPTSSAGAQPSGASAQATRTDGQSATVSSSLADLSTTIPSSMDSVYTKNFVKYTAVMAPNGKPIHIVAQDKLTDEQILRCRNILLHYLNDYPGSTYGADKSAVANKMADNGAVLALLNGQDDGSNPVGEQVNGQPLYQNEIQNEGGAWYINQNYEHRDAAYEEILHFVHDNGIGVDGGGEFRGALPEFQTEIRNAQKNASANNLWGRGADNKAWLDELAKENSLSQEYLAAVIDTYYGLWGAWTGGDTGMWGMYVSKVRDEMAAGDPMGLAVAEGKFFQPYLTYNARIDPSFDGTFSLRFDSATPYTHHSRYLRDVTLVGSNNVGVIVNELNNSVTGNDGTNTVIFSGASSEYKVETANGVTTVTDTVDGRDGINTVTLVEKLQFTDATTDL